MMDVRPAKLLAKSTFFSDMPGRSGRWVKNQIRVRRDDKILEYVSRGGSTVLLENKGDHFLWEIIDSDENVFDAGRVKNDPRSVKSLLSGLSRRYSANCNHFSFVREGGEISTKKQKEDKKMSRQRMTQRHPAGKALAAVDALERRIVQAMEDTDKELENWAEDIADEEREVAEDSTGIATDDEGDQNDKANHNWPTNASAEMAEELSSEERVALASELTQLSKGMAKRIANGGLTQKDRVFIASRLLAAAQRIAEEDEGENDEEDED